MKTSSFVRTTLLLILVLCPTLTASGGPSRIAAGASSGQLAFVQAVFDAGLVGAKSIALSPDELYLYVASGLDDAVTVFRRKDASGRLALVEVIRDGTGGANELAGAYGIAVTPDGGHVYVASFDDHALTVFSRNPVTGRLTFVEAHKDGVGDIDTLSGACSVLVSPDDKHVYVASYFDHYISFFSRNPTTGALTFMEAEGSTLLYPASIAISPDGKHIYAANQDNNSVAVFSRNTTTGFLAYNSSVLGVDGLDGPTGITVAPDGGHVYVASKLGSAVAAFQRNSGSGHLTFVEAEFDGVGGVDGLDNAVAVAVSPDGAHVYVAGMFEDAVAIFARDPAGGALSYLGTVRNGSNGVNQMYGPAGITPDQDGDHLYVAAWTPNRGAVEVFGRNASNGALTIIEEQPSGDGLQGATGVAVGSNGCVYVAGFDDNKVAYFSQNPATGALTYMGNQSVDDVSGLNGAIGVAVSPDGEHVYVAGYNDDAVVAFVADGECSGLTWLGSWIVFADGTDGARGLALSADGSTLYVASDQSDCVTVWPRDASTGYLDYWGALCDGQDSIDGLDGAYSVAVSPDGANFYVAGYNDDAVAIFGYPAGQPAFLGVVKDGVGGVDGLDGANSVVVSPDGRHVYAAGRLDDAVAIFSRSSHTGMLSYLGTVKDGIGGVDGLDGARGLAISSDGSQLYVASQLDDALAVFNRAADDGSLTFVGAHKDGVGGVDGLDTANGIAVSPSGAHIYVTGYDDDAIAVFARFRVYLPLVLR